MTSLKRIVMAMIVTAALSTSTYASSCACNGILWGYACVANCDEGQSSLRV